VAVYGVDDTQEHIQLTMEKGIIPRAVSSLEELLECCNAFMILQRRGGEHMAFAEQLIQRGYPVFIDKPVCCSLEDAQKLRHLAAAHDAVLCGGSGFKHSGQIIELKHRLAQESVGRGVAASIIYSADMDSPYDGIFFYLPHAVEVMLELFGYDPVCVKTMVRAHNDFTVDVDYGRYTVQLVLEGSKTCNVSLYGDRPQNIQIDDRDLFAGCVGHFVQAIREKRIVKDTEKLTRHVEVILAIRESIERNIEINIDK
jgi:predicted dehydrogenase